MSCIYGYSFIMGCFLKIDDGIKKKSDGMKNFGSNTPNKVETTALWIFSLQKPAQIPLTIR